MYVATDVPYRGQSEVDAAAKALSEQIAGASAEFEGTARASHAPERGRMDLRTYGVGAQILRDCGVQRMNLMGAPRRMPSMAGYGLEVAGYTPRPVA